MAMNFKVFNDKEALSAYTADLLRKQVYSNPNSIMALQNHENLEWTYEKFVGESKRYPSDFSQVYISTVSDDGDVSVLNNLPIPSDQIYTDGKGETISNILGKKKRLNLALLYLDEDGKVGFRSAENNTQLFEARELIVVVSGSNSAEVVKDLYNASEDGGSGLSEIKSHRMVTVALDKEAAGKLDDDIVEYYSYKFA